MESIRHLLDRIAPGRAQTTVAFAAILLVVSLAGAQIVAAETVDPEFEVIVTEPVLEPGTTSEVTVQLVNEADDPEDSTVPASNVRATLQSNGTPIDVRSGTRMLGELPSGGAIDTSFQVQVPEDVEPGTYDMAVEVRYDHSQDERDTTNVTATVRIDDHARFEVVGSNSSVDVGDRGTIAVDLENVGTEEAHDATVTLESTSVTVAFGQASSATRFAGDWAPGEVETFVFDASVAESAEIRGYPLRATVSYETPDGTPGTSGDLTFGITPGEEQSFAVDDVDSTLRVGGQGTLSGTITNEGPDGIEGGVVVFETENPSIEPLQTEYAIGDLAANESADFSFESRVAESTSPGPRQFTVSLVYRDENGDQRRSDELDAPADVSPEQTFDVENVTSTLRVAEEGELRGEIENTAETSVRNAVVVFEPESQTTNPIETEVALGDLAAGERAPFVFDVAVSESAGAGDRLFSVVVRYRDRNGDVRRSDSLDLRANVGPQRERFGVEPLNATVVAGSDDTVTVRVTNRGDEPITDVSAKLFASSPLAATDDEAFVGRLEPGTSDEIVFGVGAASGAIPKVYPLSIDFQYDTADGETQLSQTYRVALDVREPTGGAPVTLIVVGLVGVLVALALGVAVYRRS